jgi:hypothetical protein
VFINSGHLEEDLLQELYRIASFAVYASEQPYYQYRLRMQVERIEEQVSRRHTKIVFADFIVHYLGHDRGAMQCIGHFLYVFMTQDPTTWLLNTHEPLWKQPSKSVATSRPTLTF